MVAQNSATRVVARLSKPALIEGLQWHYSDRQVQCCRTGRYPARFALTLHQEAGTGGAVVCRPQCGCCVAVLTAVGAHPDTLR